MKPNILFLLHIPPPVHGSSVVGQYIKQSSLINKSFEARYINLMASKEVSSSGKVNLRKIGGFVKIWFKLLGELRKKKPDLCYLALTTTGAAFYRDIFVVGLLKLFRIKRVYHLHNKGVKRWSTFLINRYFYRFVFQNADVIILSKYLYPDIQAFVPENKIHICPNGISNKIEEDKPAESNNSKEVSKILFLSNLIESKGVYVLLEACSLLKEKKIPFQCDFVGGEGDITASQFYERAQKLGLNNSVNYLGKKFGTEKEEIFSKANVFAFPTFYPNECLPLVLLEAMQNKLPVISTFEGGIPDVVDDTETGFLVPQKDPRLMAEKLEILISDSNLCKKMGEAGRKKFEEEFTLIQFENRMSNILGKII
ncbi:glycosyltransferase [Maribellus comscasis]|uniref:Glycosyltransferase n=1 Tax=Maribellus comscasis TaxID=2681766 RepID=A0A6I6JS69_9BACT|nr:glycosyltransferase family 4 protein [Maribellus comscasis]QGY43918.1 glycosyltransferase [Maribellus comscasis]